MADPPMAQRPLPHVHPGFLLSACQHLGEVAGANTGKPRENCAQMFWRPQQLPRPAAGSAALTQQNIWITAGMFPGNI